MTTFRSRREFLTAVALALVAQPLFPRPARAGVTAIADPGPHPTPRAGITAEKLPTREVLADTPDAIPVFDMVREIPEIVDGIRCNCGCASSESYYSLLTCYEGREAMARHCQVCQGQGKLAYRLHKAGKSLDEIRKGVDARFG